MKESWKVNAAVVVFSGLAWALAFALHDHFLKFLAHAPGIDLVFIPSGIRLIALLVGGIWAALGISLGALLFTGPEFGTMQPGIILAVAACAGFCPYLALLASLRMTGVDAGLGNLRPLHLPLVSLGVALGSSLLHNLLFSTLGLAPWPDFADHVLAMASGDFLGIFLAVAIAYLSLRILRRRGI